MKHGARHYLECDDANPALHSDSMSCSICAKIPSSLSANTGRDEHLPAEISALVRHKNYYSAIGTDEDLWECPECGAFYIYTTETAFFGSGNSDTDTLDRLTREQSDLLRPMLDS